MSDAGSDPGRRRRRRHPAPAARAPRARQLRRRRGGRAAARRFAQLHSSPPALVLLDVSMPELDGYQTLERIRDLSDVPVIMLTAHARELEKVRGLSAGADDYVAKPFGRQELLARVQALLRRSGGASSVHEAYADDFVAIDYAERRVTVQGRDVRLTPLEFKLLATFVQNPKPGAVARPAAQAGLGRPVRRLRRPGEALRRLPPPQAGSRRPGRRADRDDARLRLPLSGLKSSALAFPSARSLHFRHNPLTPQTGGRVKKRIYAGVGASVGDRDRRAGRDGRRGDRPLERRDAACPRRRARRSRTRAGST